MTKKLNGLILAGGKSSRMKRAKAYLDFGFGPSWQHLGQVLKPLCSEVFYSVSGQLTPPLPSHLAVINDIFCEPMGPLGGIISAFKYDPKAAYLVVACDAPYFDEFAAHALIAQRAKLATVFSSEGLIEPLLGIYEPEIIKHLMHAFINGQHCLRAIVSKLDIERVTPKDSRWIANINHAHELASVQKNKRVTVHYYASMREEARQAQEVVATSAQTVSELFLELKGRHGFLIDDSVVRFAKNDRIVSGHEPLVQDDVIVLIPPVSGG